MTHYYQFVRKPEAGAEVLLDLDPDDGVFWLEEASVSPPEMRRIVNPSVREDGDVETGSSFASREVNLKLTMRPGVTAADQAAAIKTLLGILDKREGAWLKWQSEGISEPTFFRTKRASAQIVDEIADLTPDRDIMLALPADPFGYSLPVTGSATVTNDPTTGTHPMFFVMPEIEGDVLTPVWFEFPDVDAAHRTLVASQADLTVEGGEVLVYDDFNRPDNVNVGAPTIGPAPVNQAGVFGVINHSGYFSTDSSGLVSMAYPVAEADVTVEMTWGDKWGTVDGAALWLRSPSAGNGYWLADDIAYRVAAGAFTSLGAWTGSVIFEPGDVMRVVASGTSIKVYMQRSGEGEFTLVKTLTDSTYTTATNHGLSTFGANGDRIRFDDIEIRAASAGMTAPYYKALSTPWVVTSTLIDDFNRANDASAIGDTSTGGGDVTWDTENGVFGINSNQAYVVTAAGASALSRASIDFGQADIAIEVTIVTMQADGRTGILFRSNGAVGSGYAIYNNKVVIASTQVQAGSAFSATFLSGDRMRVVGVGTLIKVYRQAAAAGAWVEVYSFTTPGTYVTNTHHGLAAYGSQANTARWDNFSYDTPVTFDTGSWQRTDITDTAMVSGARNRVQKTSTNADPDLYIPFSSTVQQWDDLPPGDYRVMVRVSNSSETGIGNASPQILFFNRPPEDGTTYTVEEAASSVTIEGTHAAADWYDLGVVAMPGNAPVSDIVFDLDDEPLPALWSLGVWRNTGVMSIDLDALVLVPAGRPGTIARHGSVQFSDTYTDKVVKWDGVNGRRYALGEPLAKPGTAIPVAPIDVTGSDVEVLPGAENVIHLFATVATADSDRVGDSKALTTVVSWKYWPRRLYGDASP